jgi:hypothetical protein
MITLLPYPDYRKSVRALHVLDLGPQRVHCLQILRGVVLPGTIDSAHPGVLMWRHHVPSLLRYYDAVCAEWTRRGGTSNMIPPFVLGEQRYDLGEPLWLGDLKLHASHRSTLLARRPAEYARRKWADPSDLPLYWPVTTGEDDKMTLEQLKEKHSEMLQTAIDIGFKPKPEHAADFDSVDSGAAICKGLDMAIKTFREQQKAEAASKKDLATGSEKSNKEPGAGSTTAAETPTKPVRARTAPAKKTAKKPAAKKAAAPAEKQEKTVAKKAAAKKTAKKSAKKTAKKGAGNGATRASFNGDAKITVLVSENPMRKGSGRFDRVAKVLKSGGKSVEAYIKSGGKASTLARCVESKLVKVA